MKNKEEFYKVEAIINKGDIDEKLNQLMAELKHAPSLIFDILEKNGIKCYEVSTHVATARIVPKHIILDIAGNGLSSIRKGFKRDEIEEDEKIN